MITPNALNTLLAHHETKLLIAQLKQCQEPFIAQSVPLGSGLFHFSRFLNAGIVERCGMMIWQGVETPAYRFNPNFPLSNYNL